MKQLEQQAGELSQLLSAAWEQEVAETRIMDEEARSALLQVIGEGMNDHLEISKFLKKEVA